MHFNFFFCSFFPLGITWNCNNQTESYTPCNQTESLYSLSASMHYYITDIVYKIYKPVPCACKCKRLEAIPQNFHRMIYIVLDVLLFTPQQNAGDFSIVCANC